MATKRETDREAAAKLRTLAVDLHRELAILHPRDGWGWCPNCHEQWPCPTMSVTRRLLYVRGVIT
jgi:hypothetical protein